jgi:hypothetical protein
MSDNVINLHKEEKKDQKVYHVLAETSDGKGTIKITLEVPAEQLVRELTDRMSENGKFLSMMPMGTIMMLGVGISAVKFEGEYTIENGKAEIVRFDPVPVNDK